MPAKKKNYSSLQRHMTNTEAAHNACKKCRKLVLKKIKKQTRKIDRSPGRLDKAYSEKQFKTEGSLIEQRVIRKAKKHQKTTINLLKYLTKDNSVSRKQPIRLSKQSSARLKLIHRDYSPKKMFTNEQIAFEKEKKRKKDKSLLRVIEGNTPEQNYELYK